MPSESIADVLRASWPFACLRWIAAKRRRIALAALFLCLWTTWAARDVLVKAVLARQLERLPEVEVSVEDLHVHALLNGITFAGVEILRPPQKQYKGPAGRPLRLAQVKLLTVRWPWRGLLRGALVCAAEVDGPEASLWRIRKDSVVSPKLGKKELAPNPPPPENLVAAWPEIARFVLPMAIDRVEVKNGRFWLRDCTTDPEVKWAVGDIALTASNLTNRERLAEGRYATVDASAQPAGGRWQMHMELDPMAKAPTFGLRSHIQGVKLLQARKPLLAYARLDAEDGTFNADLEVVSEKGHFKGFVEPHIEHLRIRPRAEDEAQDSLLNRMWRTTVRAVTHLVENKQEKSIATRLPLAGEFLQPELGVWDAVLTLFGNAYLEALKPPHVVPVDALPLLKSKQRAGDQKR